MATTGLGVRRIWICRSSTFSRPIPLLGHLVVAEVAVVAPDALVAAGAERLGALPGEDDHADVVVVTGAVERVGQLEQGLRPEGVAHLRPADRDLGDPLRRGLVADVAVAVVGRTLPGHRGVHVAVEVGHHGGASIAPGYPALPCRTWSPWPCRPGPPSSRPSSGSGTAATPRSRSTSACPRRPAGRCSRRWPRPRSSTSTASSPCAGGRPVEAGDALVVATSGTTGSPRGSCSPTTPSSASATATSTRLGVDARRPLAGLPAPGPRRRPLRRDPGPGHGHAARPCCPGFDAAAVEAAARPAPRSSPSSPTALARVDPARFRVIVLGGARPPAEPARQRRHDLRADRDRQRRRLRRPAARRRRGAHRPTTARSTCGGRCCCGPTATAPTPRTPTAGSPPATSARWTPTAGWSSTAGAATSIDHRRRERLARRRWSRRWRSTRTWPRSAVAGRPDPEWGQRVVAFVVPASDATPPDLDGLRAWVKERAAGVLRAPRAGAGRADPPHRARQAPPRPPGGRRRLTPTRTGPTDPADRPATDRDRTASGAVPSHRRDGAAPEPLGGAADAGAAVDDVGLAGDPRGRVAGQERGQRRRCPRARRGGAAAGWRPARSP